MTRTFAALVVLLTAASAAALPLRLDEHCTVSVLNRTAQVQTDGDWSLPNVPSNIGQVRVRATCMENGVTRSGQSEYFTVSANGTVNVQRVFLGAGDVAAPQALAVSAGTMLLRTAGATLQLTVTATYPGGSTADVTPAFDGTSYTTSSARAVTVSADGLVTAVASGTAVVSAMNDGALGLLRLQVALSGDSDGDGIPDDVEVANGLDPNNAADAFEDPDGDGLTNLQEFQAATDIHKADTDGDGLNDGREVALGTSPVIADADGDGIDDGLEVQLGTDPLDPKSFDLARALGSITAAPVNFTITFNTITGDAFQQLAVTGTLIDNTAIDLTSTTRQTTYTSSDLSVCNFGRPDGRVFAGNAGTCTITVANNGFTAPVQGVVHTFTPTALSFIGIPGFANNVDVNGNFAYVAAGAAGLQVVDVSDRSKPAIVAALATAGNADDVKVVGSRAYVADGLAGLTIIDVTDPLVPARLGSVHTPGEAWAVAVTGTLALVADGDAGLQVIDASTPASPTIVGSVDTPGTAKGVDVAGTLAVVADGSTGLQVVDISDPTKPRIVGAVDTPGDARDVALDGSFAYVADYTGGLEVVDVSTAAMPHIVGATVGTEGGYLMDVALSGPPTARVALGADVKFVNAVPIIGVADPTMPLARAPLDFTVLQGARDDNGTGIAVDGSFVYLTASRGITENGTSEDTRLYIGQYLALEDLARVPPTVSITSPAPATQVIEGDTIPVAVAATDDVAVSAVRFLVSGSEVSIDTAAPYEASVTVPTGATSLTLGATATDLGGNVGRADDVVLAVIHDPLTTVVGRVTDPQAHGIGGATVVVRGRSTATAADGSFTLASVSTIGGLLQATASAPGTAGTLLVGSSSAIAAVRGGTTDVGTIAVRGTFDLSADYSVASNPNGVWSYGATRQAGSIVLYTEIGIGNDFGYWHIAPGIPEAAGAPAIVKNLLDTPKYIGFGLTYPPHQVAFHPGASGELCVFRFTAPATADYRIETMLGGGDGGTKRVHVLQGATELFQRVVGPPAPFVTERHLAVGDTIDLAVDPFDGFQSDTTFVSATITPTASGPVFLGPSPYLSRPDSPFDLSGLGTTFFLEDFEDGALDTPGVTADHGAVIPPGASCVDDVDGDVGPSGSSGHSFHYFAGGAPPAITFTFDAVALGSLPTRVGVVWADGQGPTTFEAFDGSGLSLGQLGPVVLDDGTTCGSTAEDRFFGVVYPGGIGSIRVSDSGGGAGLELDHLQYGR